MACWPSETEGMLLLLHYRLEVPMNELSVLWQDATLENFIVNDEAHNEMMQIARAAHFKQDFKIFQPTFFSLGHSDGNLCKPHMFKVQHLFLVWLMLQKMHCHLFSVWLQVYLYLVLMPAHHSGSSRSVDSNISQSSRTINFRSKVNFE